MRRHTQARNRNDPRNPGMCRIVREFAEAYARVQWLEIGDRTAPLLVTEEHWTFAARALALCHALITNTHPYVTH